MANMTIGRQEAHLRGCLSDGMRHFVKFYLSVAASTPIDQVLDQLEAYLEKVDSIVHRRQWWYELRQKQGESYTDFYVRLRRTAQEAKVENMTYDNHLASKLIAGIRDEELSKELLRPVRLSITDSIRPSISLKIGHLGFI